MFNEFHYSQVFIIVKSNVRNKLQFGVLISFHYVRDFIR